jgi:hypothetical protein
MLRRLALTAAAAAALLAGPALTASAAPLFAPGDLVTIDAFLVARVTGAPAPEGYYYVVIRGSSGVELISEDRLLGPLPPGRG